MAMRYLIRLDDACPTMDLKKWRYIEEIFDRNGVKPLVGVIPDNADPDMLYCGENPDFWGMVRNWQAKGWAIALHGYNHKSISDKGLSGMNPMWKRSEFSGVDLSEQKDHIRKGEAVFKKHGMSPRYFFAPFHTFDLNTLKALDDETDIRVIIDTVALKPYSYGNFSFIPQYGGKCRRTFLPGIRTICLHPSFMDARLMEDTASFVKKHRNEIGCIDDVDLSALGPKTSFDNLLSLLYFSIRKLKIAK